MTIFGLFLTSTSSRLGKKINSMHGRGLRIGEAHPHHNEPTSSFLNGLPKLGAPSFSSVANNKE